MPDKTPEKSLASSVDPEVLAREESLPKKKASLFRVEKFEGPLPPPALLKEYATIDPTFPDRIMRMAETRLGHVQKMEWWTLWTVQGLNFLGKICGFIFGFGAMAGGYLLIYTGHDVKGFIVAFAGLAPLIAAFIWSEVQKQKASELRKKRPKDEPKP